MEYFLHGDTSFLVMLQVLVMWKVGRNLQFCRFLPNWQQVITNVLLHHFRHLHPVESGICSLQTNCQTSLCNECNVIVYNGVHPVDQLCMKWG